MIRELPARPDLSGDAFVFGMPVWLATVLRLVIGAAAPTLAWLSVQDWERMPMPARGLVIVLVPALLGWALWPQAWRGAICFVADRQGLYFPHHSQVIHVAGRPEDPRWLFVPWARITQLRVARVRGDDGPCVAFDIDALSAAQREDYFRQVDAPDDRPRGAGSPLAVAYANRPPSPRVTLERLERLRSGGAD